MLTEDFSKINGEGTILREAQLRILDILIEVDKICRKHNIEYWLMGGTLLGAVRHNGYIPWDDDIDISIQYKDIGKLREVLINELPQQYVIQDSKIDKNYFIDSIFKIRDTKSYFPIETHRSFKNQGLFLDIIPMEKMPSMWFKRFVFNFNKHPYLRRKEISLQGKSVNIAGLILAPFSSVLLRFAHWYSENSKTNTFGYNYIFYLGRFFHMQYKKEMIFPLKTMKFEGVDFFVPNDTDSFLKETYGDYMKIPSTENRTVHASGIEIYK